MNDGVEIVINESKKYLKDAPHYFSDDDVTDQNDKVMVAEMIREKLLRSLEREVPHGIAVDIERFFERDLASGEPILEVEATIYCEKSSHKGIIIGKNGAMLKNIGSKSRTDIEEFLGEKVNLKLWVKVKNDWRNKENKLRYFGYKPE
jgi:GTP-binding protein Era